jgi:hypothetical protein
MSLATLSVELKTDPAGMGYVGKTDQQCYDLLTALTRTRKRTLGTTDILEWAGSNQRYLKIKNAAAGADSQTKNLAAILEILIENPGEQLDLKNNGMSQLIDALVTAGVLTAADRAALVAMATENISRLDEIGEGPTHLAAIAAARA